MRTWHSLLVAMSAVTVSGCKSNDDVKFVRDAPTAIPAGQTYEYVFHVTRPVDKAFFMSCDSRSEPKVDRDGKVTFVSSDRTEMKICVEYHMTDGPTLDKYEVTVKVGKRVAVGTEGFPKPIQEVHSKLKAALGAVETGASAAPATCPKLGGYAHVYQVDWLKQLVATPTKPLASDTFFLPPSQMYQLLTQPEETPTMLRDLTERTHAVIVKQEKVVAPKYAKGTGPFQPSAFEGGSFEGIAYVVDLASAKLACGMPLAFESSKEITFFKGKDEGPVEPKRVIMLANDDLRENGRKALEKALRKAGTDLTPVY
jgi:hypothetical protein